MNNNSYNIWLYSHIGNSREKQEDNYFIGKGKYLSADDRNQMQIDRKCKVDSYKSDQICCCISDGMGGHNSGEVASFLTVSYLDKNCDELFNNWDISSYNVNEFVKKLNNYICEISSKDDELTNMGATLCGVIYSRNSGFCFNIGDSRAYKVCKDNISQITVDNTEGQRLLKLGLLTEKELDDFPKKKTIYKYIGKPVELISDIYEVDELKKENIWYYVQMAYLML